MSSKLVRDTSTPEGRRIWEAVERAASNAPQQAPAPQSDQHEKASEPATKKD